MGQLQVVTLKCSNYAASLQIGARVDQLACGYCGSHQQVVRQGGAISLERFAGALAGVSRSADRAAAELAIPRLEKELHDLSQRRQATNAGGIYRTAALRAEFKQRLALAAFVPVAIGLFISGAFGGFVLAMLISVPVGILGALACVLFLLPKTRTCQAEIDGETRAAIAALDTRAAVVMQMLERNRWAVER